MLVSFHLKKEYSIILIAIILFIVFEKFIKYNLNYETIIKSISQTLLIIVYFIEENLFINMVTILKYIQTLNLIFLCDLFLFI